MSCNNYDTKDIVGHYVIENSKFTSDTLILRTDYSFERVLYIENDFQFNENGSWNLEKNKLCLKNYTNVISNIKRKRITPVNDPNSLSCLKVSDPENLKIIVNQDIGLRYKKISAPPALRSL